MSRETRVDEASGGVREQAETSQGGFALESAGNVIGQCHDLDGRAKDELPWMQDEWIITLWLEEAGEVRLFLAWIDVRVAVIFEDSKPPVETNVDAGWLHHALVKGVDSDPASVDFGQDVAV